METAISLGALLELIAIVVSVVGGIKAVDYVVDKINKRHDKNQKIDSNGEDIKRCNERMDHIEREMKEYAHSVEADLRSANLDSIKRCHDRIDELTNKLEESIKISEEALTRQKEDFILSYKDMKEEQCMLTYCMMATLDGLHQLGANGPVTEARDALDKFMNKQAHEVK